MAMNFTEMFNINTDYFSNYTHVYLKHQQNYTTALYEYLLTCPYTLDDAKILLANAINTYLLMVDVRIVIFATLLYILYGRYFSNTEITITDDAPLQMFIYQYINNKITKQCVLERIRSSLRPLFYRRYSWLITDASIQTFKTYCNANEARKNAYLEEMFELLVDAYNDNRII